jgi:hypothetical protein
MRLARCRANTEPDEADPHTTKSYCAATCLDVTSLSLANSPPRCLFGSRPFPLPASGDFYRSLSSNAI